MGKEEIQAMTKHASDFSWWQKALAGERGPISEGEPMHGFYRQRSGRSPATRLRNEPVAYWKDETTGALRCHVNGKEADPQRALEMWPYVSKNPISAELYWHFMDTGKWLDNDPAAHAVAQGPDIDPEADPAGSLAAEIAKAKAGLAAYKTIESDEAAARAQSLRSTLTSLSGKATKAYEALNRPLLDEQKRIREVWFPLRDDAAAGADAIRKALGAWNDVKLAAARAAEEATRKAAAEEAARVAEAHRKAAAEAAAANQPPPPAPEPPKVEPVKPNAPAPSTIIRGGSGRAASVRIVKTVTAIDLDKAFTQFRDAPELYACLMDLTQRAVTAGITCDGATVEDKSDIR